MFNSIKSKAGTIKLVKSFRNADPNDLRRINRRTGKYVTIKDLSQIYHLRFANPVSVTDVINQLKVLPEVEYVHQAVTVGYFYTPNDPYFTTPGQWNLDVVQATDAWNITTDSSYIKIGIVDRGVYYNHPDLQGRNFRTDGIITAPHGTWVAGVHTNNAIGIASLGFNIKLNSYNFDVSFADAIDMCVIYSDIINMSFGTLYVMTYNDLVEIGCPSGKAANQWVGSFKPYNYGVIEDAIENALEEGVVCVASGGNASFNYPAFQLCIYPELCDCSRIPFTIWPAAYPGVIGVSATELYQGNERNVSGWNYGSFIDVSAPGINILTTNYPSGYSYEDGTSFSAPLTSALCGLLLSLNSNLTIQQIADYINNSTDKVDASNHPYDGNGWNQYLGYGRINAYDAVKPPSAPQNLSYTVVNGHPRLSWTASDWDVKLYEVWRDLGSGYQKIAEVNSPSTTYTDNSVMINVNNPYIAWYYLKSKDLTNLTSSPSSLLRVHYHGLQKRNLEIMQIPSDPTLYQNFPNPFNPTTIIGFSIPTEQFVTIKLYNGLGQEIETIIDEKKDAGYYQINYDASKLSSGIYFCRMITRNQISTRKMILQR